MEYKVITAGDKEEFEKEVMSCLANGFELVGGVSLSLSNGNRFYYVQAVIKK